MGIGSSPSLASVEMLEALRTPPSPVGWCFPSPTRAGKAIAATSMAKALKRAACGRGGRTGASGRKRRGAILRPVGPVRQAPRPDGPLGEVVIKETQTNE